jgi:hypothetical protein
MIMSHDADLPLLRHPPGRFNVPIDQSDSCGVEPVLIERVGKHGRPNQTF